MDIRITPAIMGGEVSAIASKSYAHRMLMCAMLTRDNGVINNVVESKDIKATINFLNALNTKVDIKDNKFYLSSGDIPKTANIDCIESGSTVRFILSILAALKVNAFVTGKEGLQKRPLIDLIKVLRENGEYVDSDTLPLNMSGEIKSGEYRINGSISSQYITGLLMALPILSGDSKIVIEGNLVSKSYLDITLEVLRLFKIDIKEETWSYAIKGNQKYIMPDNLAVQGDWSNAAFFIVLGAINKDIKVNNLVLDSNQGDREIIDIVEKMGAKVNKFDNSVSVTKAPLHSIELDAKNIPDLVPIVSILMACAEGESKITNVDRLKIKETDRLKAVQETLDRMGIENRYESNTLYIKGGVIKPFSSISYNDHRMVMMQAIAASIASGDSIIQGIEAVEKSYPTFFEDYKSLGGKCNV